MILLSSHSKIISISCTKTLHHSPLNPLPSQCSNWEGAIHSKPLFHISLAPPIYSPDIPWLRNKYGYPWSFPVRLGCIGVVSILMAVAEGDRACERPRCVMKLSRHEGRTLRSSPSLWKVQGSGDGGGVGTLRSISIGLAHCTLSWQLSIKGEWMWAWEHWQHLIYLET